jgi:hypothetical protein
MAMRMPKWTWHWAWTAFQKWCLNPTLASNITAGQRWQVVLWSLRPGIKHHYVEPVTEWLHRHLPTAVLLARLQRHGAGWFRVTSIPAAIHLWRRLGVHVLKGDFVRIERGLVTMKGYVDEDLQVCEFWPIEE